MENKTAPEATNEPAKPSIADTAFDDLPHVEARDSFSAPPNQSYPAPAMPANQQVSAPAPTTKQPPKWLMTKPAITIVFIITVAVFIFLVYIKVSAFSNVMGDFLDDVVGLKTRTLTNGGYTYSFKFYRSVQKTQVRDATGLATGTGSLIVTEPASDPLLSNCADLGNDWTQAFTATLGGAERPVCTQADNVKRIYATNFAAYDVTHLVVLRVDVNGELGSTSKAGTEKVKSMLNSVSVSKK